MDQDVWNRDDGHLTQAVRMVIAAVASAALTATLVIAVGDSILDRRAPVPNASDAVLIQASH